MQSLRGMGAAGPGLVGSVGCCLFALVIAPAYAQMFSDFDNPVPALTKLMLMPGPPLAFATLGVVLVGLAARATDERRRSRLLTAAALVGIGGFIFCLAAMWLPDLAQLQAVPSDGVDG